MRPRARAWGAKQFSKGSTMRSKCHIVVILLTLALVDEAVAQATPGYNHKIPQQIMTPDTVETRIGTLKFFDGLPTDETVEKAYDNLDFMRGVDVFLNFIPATSMEAIRRGLADVGVAK